MDLKWWRNSVDVAYRDRFTDLAVTTPCCSTRTTLNDLVFDWPAGFSRFVLEARNPGVRDLSVTLVADLGRILGCSLRPIRARI